MLTSPARPWTVWNDGDTEPLDEAITRQEAERLLLGYPDHDYAYIQSPSGEQYTWNPFRRSWEQI
jgi:hypothetical protein